MSELLSVSGRSALVTGAGQGVGRSIALQLAAYGASVAVNDFFGQRAQEVVDEITAAGGKALAVPFDVTDYAAVTQAVNEVADGFGTLDILVNNAGNAGPVGDTLASTPPFWETEPEAWEPWIATNFHGVLNTTRAAVPGMVERRWGRVINMMSDAGRVGEPHLVVYSGAKAGVGGFTRALAKSLGRYHVTANCVALSGINTESVRSTVEDPERAKAALRHYVIRRFGETSDVANMILFLAADTGEWITGQTYPVNGGYSFAV